MSRFVLLDSDGTVNVERNYLSDPDQLELLPRVTAGLRRLKQVGFGLAVITNQSGIGRGYFDLAKLDLIDRMEQFIFLSCSAHQGISLDI